MLVVLGFFDKIDPFLAQAWINRPISKLALRLRLTSYFMFLGFNLTICFRWLTDILCHELFRSEVSGSPINDTAMIQPGVALWVHCSLAKITTNIERLIHSRIHCILKTVLIWSRLGPAEGTLIIAAVKLRYRLVAVGWDFVLLGSCFAT